MKKSLLILFLALGTHILFAQAFAKDTVHINAGVGLGWPYKFEKIYASMWSLPAFSASIERGFYAFDSIGSISVGLQLSYKYLENKRLNKVATWNNYLVGATAKFNFYYFNNYKIIPYAGLYGGINAIKFEDTFYSNSNDYPTNYNGVFPLAYIFAGAKYISKPTFGVYGEFSYGFTYFTLGLYKVL